MAEMMEETTVEMMAVNIMQSRGNAMLGLARYLLTVIS